MTTTKVQPVAKDDLANYQFTSCQIGTEILFEGSQIKSITAPTKTCPAWRVDADAGNGIETFFVVATPLRLTGVFIDPTTLVVSDDVYEDEERSAAE